MLETPHPMERELFTMQAAIYFFLIRLKTGLGGWILSFILRRRSEIENSSTRQDIWTTGPSIPRVMLSLLQLGVKHSRSPIGKGQSCNMEKRPVQDIVW